MPWYLYSIVAMLSFSAMMLFVKKIRDNGFSSIQVNLFLFGFVFFGFFLANINLFPKISNFPNFGQLLILLVVAALAAIFANLADIKAVGIAPNPGYSQALKNSNILPITILSIFIFGLSFDLMKIFGTILVILGIIFLIKKERVDQFKQNLQDKPWYIYSLAAIVFFTILVLILKKATFLGFSSKEINLFLFGFSWIGFLILGHKEIKNISQNYKFLPFLGLVFLASLCSFIGNLFDVEAIKLAPNPGYAQAIKNANILVITILSTRFFSSDFKPLRVIGAAIILIGIILLVI